MPELPAHPGPRGRPEPRRLPTPDEVAREEGRRNLIKTVGLTLFGLGLVAMLISIGDFVMSVALDHVVHYAWLFFAGMGVMVVGWWFLLTGYQAKHELISVDCPRCGAINTAGADGCRLCGAPLD